MAVTRTAQSVRDWFNADPKRVARLSETAKAALAPKRRGRLPAEVIKVYNSKRRKDDRYEGGNTTKVNADRKAARAALVAQGVAGKRGPLPKALRG